MEHSALTDEELAILRENPEEARPLVLQLAVAQGKPFSLLLDYDDVGPLNDVVIRLLWEAGHMYTNDTLINGVVFPVEEKGTMLVGYQMLTGQEVGLTIQKHDGHRQRFSVEIAPTKEAVRQAGGRFPTMAEALRVFAEDRKARFITRQTVAFVKGETGLGVFILMDDGRKRCLYHYPLDKVMAVISPEAHVLFVRSAVPVPDQPSLFP